MTDNLSPQSIAKLSPKEISELRQNLEYIQQYKGESLNLGFNPNLIQPKAEQKEDNKKEARKIDFSLWTMIIFTILYIFILAVVCFVTLEQGNMKFCLLMAIMFCGISVLACQIKFGSATVTAIAAAVGMIVIIIGFDIQTPKEAFESIKSFSGK